MYHFCLLLIISDPGQFTDLWDGWGREGWCTLPADLKPCSGGKGRWTLKTFLSYPMLLGIGLGEDLGVFLSKFPKWPQHGLPYCTCLAGTMSLPTFPDQTRKGHNKFVFSHFIWNWRWKGLSRYLCSKQWSRFREWHLSVKLISLTKSPENSILRCTSISVSHSLSHACLLLLRIL